MVTQLTNDCQKTELASQQSIKEIKLHEMFVHITFSLLLVGSQKLFKDLDGFICN